MTSPRRLLLLRYSAAPLSIAVASVVRALFKTAFGFGYPLLTFYAASMLTAWFAGLGPALLALGLGLAATLWLFTPTPGSFAFHELGHHIRLVLYVIFGIGSSVCIESLRAAQRRAADNLREALNRQQRLEQEVARRQRLEEALRQADRRKDEFLAMLAHELRNPLAPVRNALHILREHGADAEGVEALRAMMQRQIEHLSRLVDDLLDVSRITQGTIRLRKEVVELAPLVCHTVEALRPAVEARRLDLTVSLPEEPIRLQADPTRLEQVLTNLLANAAKFTALGGAIVLTAQRKDDGVELCVRDTGAGIAPEVLPHVFELFVQAERGLDRSEGGLGIGLTLVQRLVELHGGTVQAASAGLGRGSEFSVWLPTLEGPVEGQGPAPADGNPGVAATRRILVVDDDRDVANTCSLLLSLAGHEVHTVYDGPTALAAAGPLRPDVVLLDLGMPGMDGYEVARRLRRQPDLRDVVLVALTGWSHDDDRRRSREAGFDRHLTKPVDPAALKQAVTECTRAAVSEGAPAHPPTGGASTSTEGTTAGSAMRSNP
jgi:signal transduction histidine kinase/ActR/RegA family two-component response regulator